MNDMVIVKVEVDHIKHAICHAFNSYTLNLNKMVQDKVNEAMDSEKLVKLISEMVDKNIDAGISASIEEFFASGPGRKSINEEVSTALLKRLKGGKA